MAKKICLITGGNAGIGQAAAVQLAREGAAVVIACRSPERGAQAVETICRQSGSADVSFLVMDLASRQSVLEGCQAFRQNGYRHLDVLIHNAADFDVSRKQPAYSADGVETIWATNHIGPVLLTQQLEGELSASQQGRVITVASQGLVMHPFLRVRLDDPEFHRGGFRVDQAYYQSKLAQVMYTLWLAERFRGTAKTANCVRVTNVRIDLDRYPHLSEIQKRLYSLKVRFAISPEQMAAVYTWLALSLSVRGVSGGYFDEKRRQVSPGRYALDAGNIRQVMELTGKYVPGLPTGHLPDGRG
jgi:NAD(P)-dependent dehydrogenase (short-subunit alcohol dehydrogenase family)